MPRPLRQNTAVNVTIGPFVDNTDGFTAETGLTLSQADIRLSKNDGAFAQKNDATAATHKENGYYSCPLNATDTNTLGILFLAVNEAGALPVWVEIEVMTQEAWDALYAGTGNGIRAAVITYPGNTPQTGDAFARLGAPAGASVSADIAAIEAQTDDIGAAGAGLTAVPYNAAWDAQIESEVTDALVALHLDHLLAVTYDPAAKPGAADALLNELIGNDGGVSQFTANAVELAPTGGSAPTVAQIADGVWDELRAGHVAAGSFGEHVLADAVLVGGATPEDAAAIADAVLDEDMTGHQTQGTLGKTIGDPVADTDTIWDVLDKLRTAIELDGAVYRFTANALEQAPGGGGLTVAAIVAGVWDELTSVGRTAGSFGQLFKDNVNATISSRATPAQVNTECDTALADYDAPTFAELDARTDAIEADTQDIQARLPAALVAGRIDASVGAMVADVLTSTVLATSAVDEIRDAIFARAFSAAYSNLTFDQLVKLIASVLLGKLSGGGTGTETFRNLADNANTVVGTVDASGNRTAVVLTP